MPSQGEVLCSYCLSENAEILQGLEVPPQPREALLQPETPPHPEAQTEELAVGCRLSDSAMQPREKAQRRRCWDLPITSLQYVCASEIALRQRWRNTLGHESVRF